MKARLLVAAIGVPFVLLVIIVFPKWVLAVLMAAMCAIAVYELLHVTHLLSHARVMLYTAILAALVPIWSYFGGPLPAAITALTVYCILLFVELLAAYRTLRVESLCTALLAGILIPVLLSSLVRLMQLEHGRIYLCIPIAIAFLADGGAYFAGRAFGKHKMAPHVSPHKTVEGLIGGILTALIAMLIYAVVCRYGFHYKVNYLAAAIYGLVGAGASVLGDLGFSAIKRQTGIKDYGHLLPGHGGVLDRFDSMVLVAPVIEVLVWLMPLLGGKIA
jgi:phosphatidate cytidylyltransferase